MEPGGCGTHDSCAFPAAGESDAKIGRRLRRAQQDEASLAFVFKVCSRIPLVHRPFEQRARTSETPALVANSREFDAAPFGSVPDGLLGSTGQMPPERRLQEDCPPHKRPLYSNPILRMSSRKRTSLCRAANAGSVFASGIWISRRS